MPTSRRRIPPPPRGLRGDGLFLCPTTKKRQYPDRQQAEKIIRSAAANRGPGQVVPVRSYHCTDCGHWHITSQTAGEWALNHEHRIADAVGMETEDWVAPKVVRRCFGKRSGTWRPHTNADNPVSSAVGFRLHPQQTITVAVMVLPAATVQHRHEAAVAAHDAVAELLGPEGTFWWCTTPVMGSSGLERLGFYSAGQWTAVISQ